MNSQSTFHQKRQISLGKRSYIPYQASQIVIASPDTFIFFQENELNVCVLKEKLKLKQEDILTKSELSFTLSNPSTPSNISTNYENKLHSTVLPLKSALKKPSISNDSQTGKESSNDILDSSQMASTNEISNKNVNTNINNNSNSSSYLSNNGRNARFESNISPENTNSSLRKKRSKNSRIRFADSISCDYDLLSFKFHGSISCVDLFHNYIVVVLMEGSMAFLKIQDGELERHFQCTSPANVYCMKCIEDSNQIILLSNDRRLYVYGCSTVDSIDDSIPTTSNSPVLQSSLSFPAFNISRESLDSLPSGNTVASDPLHSNYTMIHTSSQDNIRPSFKKKETQVVSKISKQTIIDLEFENENKGIDVMLMHCEASWFVNRHMYSISRIKSLENNFEVDKSSLKEIVLLIGFTSGEFAELHLNKKNQSANLKLNDSIGNDTISQEYKTNISKADIPSSYCTSLKNSQSIDSIDDISSHSLCSNELRIYKHLQNDNVEIEMPLFVCGDLKWKNTKNRENQDLQLAVFASLDGYIIVDDPKNFRNNLLIQEQSQSLETLSTNASGMENPVRLNDSIIHWQLSLDTEIVGVVPVDIDGDGYDEIMVVTWDGMTYFIDQFQNVVTFNLKQRVKSFAVGKFRSLDDMDSLDEEEQLCIFYVTFSDKIIVCSKANMESISMKTFDSTLEISDIEAIQQLCSNREEIRESDIPRIIESILYDTPNESVLNSYINYIEDIITSIQNHIRLSTKA